MPMGEILYHQLLEEPWVDHLGVQIKAVPFLSGVKVCCVIEHGTREKRDENFARRFYFCRFQGN